MSNAKRTSARLQEKAAKIGLNPAQVDSSTSSKRPGKATRSSSKPIPVDPTEDQEEATKNGSKSSPPPSADPAVNVETFNFLFKNLKATEWKKYLSKVPERLADPELQTLLSLMKKLDIKVDQARETLDDKTELHCVRCHKVYLEKDNSIVSCHITHDEMEGERVFHGPSEILYSCHTCGKETYDESFPGDFFTCYKGRHTIDPRNVKYDDIYTLTCEEAECDED